MSNDAKGVISRIGFLKGNLIFECHQSYRYRVTHIIVNDVESKKLYAVNFINRQILYRLIGMISKIVCGKYYTASSQQQS